MKTKKEINYREPRILYYAIIAVFILGIGLKDYIILAIVAAITIIISIIQNEHKPKRPK